jgi:hypothetical protein
MGLLSSGLWCRADCPSLLRNKPHGKLNVSHALEVIIVKIKVFRNVRPCQLIISSRHFEGTRSARNVGNHWLIDTAWNPRSLGSSPTRLGGIHVMFSSVFRLWVSGVQKALPGPMACGASWVGGGMQTYRVLRFVVHSFGLDFGLLNYCYELWVYLCWHLQCGTDKRGACRPPSSCVRHCSGPYPAVHECSTPHALLLDPSAHTVSWSSSASYSGTPAFKSQSRTRLLWLNITVVFHSSCWK